MVDIKFIHFEKLKIVNFGWVLGHKLCGTIFYKNGKQKNGKQKNGKRTHRKWVIIFVGKNNVNGRWVEFVFKNRIIKIKQWGMFILEPNTQNGFLRF